MHEKTPQLITTARCKVIWGESASSVKEFLSAANIPPAEAETLIASLVSERHNPGYRD
jgi:hypothetical protein